MNNTSFYTNKYYSIKYGDFGTPKIYANKLIIYNNILIKSKKMLITGSVLYSSDGEVRIFGMDYNIYKANIIKLIEELSLSNEGMIILRKLTSSVKYFIYKDNVYDDTNKNNIMELNIYKKYNKEQIIDKNKIYSSEKKLILYYCYIKYYFGNIVENIIDSDDIKLINYLDNLFEFNQDNIDNISAIFYNSFYKNSYENLPFILKYVQKITLAKYDIEYKLNKFLSYINNYKNPISKQKEIINILLPSYLYYTYKFDINNFIDSDKLLIKLKFKNLDTIETNVYIGNFVGKTLYQYLMNIKNKKENTPIMEEIDLRNIITMNIFNLRFLHLCGLSHNDLHLNNIVYNYEPEQVLILEKGISQTYELSLFDKFYLDIGRFDFNIIDFGRALYIDDKDNILRNIQRWDISFYEKYITKMNIMFQKDPLMTGYILTLFDYIEYIKNIIIGFKYVENDKINFEKLNNIIKYIYEILDAYFAKTNKELVKKLYKILKYDKYKLMPEFIKNFNFEMVPYEIYRMWLSGGNSHPIDLVIDKFYPELYPINRKTITRDNYNKLHKIYSIEL